MDTMPATATAPPQRILSIDILRGLTIALMIVVNDAGDGAHYWWPLEHAEWNGYTPTDLVFPTFLFLVGCSIVFSMAGRITRGANRSNLALHVVRRSVIIILLGWVLTLMPYFHVTTLRFYGVLARIGLCYLISGLLFLRVQRPRTLAIITRRTAGRLLDTHAIRAHSGHRNSHPRSLDPGPRPKPRRVARSPRRRLHPAVPAHTVASTRRSATPKASSAACPRWRPPCLASSPACSCAPPKLSVPRPLACSVPEPPSF